MIELIKGAKVPKNKELEEGYEIQESTLIANVNASKILNIINDFVRMNPTEYFFLFIEVPTNKEEEEKQETLHKDVYYLDGIKKKEVQKIMEEFSEIFIQDGLIHFGFGTTNNDEIGKYKYNIVKIYSKDVKKYESLINSYSISKKEKLKTAWDTFTKEMPGESVAYKDKKGRTIYDCIEILKEKGLYKAKTIEE